MRMRCVGVAAVTLREVWIAFFRRPPCVWLIIAFPAVMHVKSLVSRTRVRMVFAQAYLFCTVQRKTIVHDSVERHCSICRHSQLSCWFWSLIEQYSNFEYFVSVGLSSGDQTFALSCLTRIHSPSTADNFVHFSGPAHFSACQLWFTVLVLCNITFLHQPLTTLCTFQA